MSQGNGTVPEFELNPERDMVIKLMDNGNIRIVGPLTNKIYCFGLLELARQAVHLHKTPEPSSVVAAPATALEGLPEPDFQTPKRR